MEMSLVQFFGHVGLWLEGDKKLEQLKALTPADRAWFVERAKIEYGITIAAPAGK